MAASIRPLHDRVLILRVDEEITAQLFAGFREGSIGDEPLAFTHPDTGRRRGWVQGGGCQILPARMDVLRDLRGRGIRQLPS